MHALSTMKFPMLSLLCAIAFVGFVDPLRLYGPRQTHTDEAGGTATLRWTPKPTKPPIVKASPMDLFKRDPFDSNLCGYISGDAASPTACPIGRTCMLHTCGCRSVAVGCCSAFDTTNCDYFLDCVDSTRYSDCGSECQGNSFTRKCTDNLSPYCLTYKFTDVDAYYYDCFTASGSTVIVANDTSTSFPLPASPALSSSFSSSSSSSSSTAATPVVTIIQATAGADSQKSTPVGAIVGGTIGGVIALGAVIGGIIFLLRRKKNQHSPTNNAYYPTFPPGPMQQYPEEGQHYPYAYPSLANQQPAPAYHVPGKYYDPARQQSPPPVSPVSVPELSSEPQSASHR